MTERERDKRDLAILADFEAGLWPRYVAEKYNVTREYINQLLEGASE